MIDGTATETRTPNRGAGSSREVNLFAVHQLLEPLLGDPDFIPGTPSWTQLPDDDSAKWRAVLWAAMWWAVAEDARQDAVAQAGQAIAEAENWGQVSRDIVRRREIDELRRAG